MLPASMEGRGDYAGAVQLHENTLMECLISLNILSIFSSVHAQLTTGQAKDLPIIALVDPMFFLGILAEQLRTSTTTSYHSLTISLNSLCPVADVPEDW